MASLKKMVPGPFLPSLVMPSPWLEHPMRRDDVGDALTPTESRHPKELGPPEPMKMNDVRPRLALPARGIGADGDSRPKQESLEGSDRDPESTGSLLLWRLVKEDVHPSATSR
jgi:hypothetical protein